MSNLLRSLMINEQIACFFWANSSFALLLTKNEWFAFKNMTKIVYFDTLFKKTSNLLIPSFLMSNVSKSLRLLTKNEWCERIAQVDHQKWVTMSELLTKMIKWVNRSFLEQIAHLLIILQKRAIHSENRWANSQPRRRVSITHRPS